MYYYQYSYIWILLENTKYINFQLRLQIEKIKSWYMAMMSSNWAT